MNSNVVTFHSPSLLTNAYRNDTLDACNKWIPILEESIKHSESLIAEYIKETSTRYKRFNTQKFLLIFWEKRQLARKRHFLSILLSQKERLESGKSIILSTEEIENVERMKNLAIN